MRKCTIATILAAFVLLTPTVALAQDVADLLGAPRSYGGQEVTLTGELVGDFSSRGDGVWVQLNDDNYVEAPLAEQGLGGINTGMGIRIPTASFDPSWGPAGGFNVRGPIVEVTGVFRYQDPDRSGETYIDVSSVRLISISREIDGGAGGWPLIVGGVMVALASILLFRRRHKTPTGRVLPRL